MLVFFNGEIINDLSYQFGYGLFETIRCEEGVPLFFEDHYKRLTKSASELKMPFPVEKAEVKEWIIKTLKVNNLEKGRIKIILSKRIENEDEKFNVLIQSNPLDILSESYTLISKNVKEIFYPHKITSRMEYHVGFKSALEAGFNDTLYINEKNEITECSRSNIFLVQEDRIITPSLDSGILPGITRAKIIEVLKSTNMPIEEKKVQTSFLNKVKEVFVTNAIIGVMPVSMIKTNDKEYKFNNIKVKEISANYSNLIKRYLGNVITRT